MANPAINLNAALPSVDSHLAVVPIKARLNRLNAELADVVKRRQELEAKLGEADGVSRETLEARALATGGTAEFVEGVVKDIAAVDAARRQERVISEAIALVAAELKLASERAKRDVSKRLNDDYFLPAAKSAAASWLKAVSELEAFRRFVVRLQDAGLSCHSPFNWRVPVTAFDRHELSAFVDEIIKDGHLTREQVAQAIPSLG